MMTNGIFFITKCYKYVKFNVCYYDFFSVHFCEHVMCWGGPLYCEPCVCPNTQQLVLWKHLSHSLDCFKNGPVLSFALVHGADLESFCVWLNFYEGVDLLSPETTSLLGGRLTRRRNVGRKPFECVRKALRLSQSGQWRHDKSVQNFNCFHTHKAELNWAIWGCLEMFVTVITALH